jgi:hypothetical protein
MLRRNELYRSVFIVSLFVHVPTPLSASRPTQHSQRSSSRETLSALAGGFSGLQPSFPKSPEPSPESKDKAFTPPEVLEKPRSSQSPMPSPFPSALSPAKPAPPALQLKANKPSLALRFRSSVTPKVNNTLSLNVYSAIPPLLPPSTSSDAPIPHITRTPFARSCQEPSAFAVTSRPTSRASNLSIGMPAALDKSVAEADNRSEPCGAVPAIADQPKQDQQRWRPPQEESLPTSVRVVQSVVPLKSSGEEPLPLLRLHSRPHLPTIEVTVLNTHCI